MDRKQNSADTQTKKGALCPRKYWGWILCQSKCLKIKHGCQNNYTYLEKERSSKNQEKTAMGGRPSKTNSSNKQWIVINQAEMQKSIGTLRIMVFCKIRCS